MLTWIILPQAVRTAKVLWTLGDSGARDDVMQDCLWWRSSLGCLGPPDPERAGMGSDI
jgi:hypothetical protein